MAVASCALSSAAPQTALPAELAAQAGDLALSFTDLDRLLLDRYGAAPEGQEALGELVDRRMVAALAEEQQLVIDDARLAERWLEIDRATRAEGVEGGLEEYLAENGVDRVEFRRLLRLSIAQEELARRALGIPPDGPISAEQQEAWLAAVVAERGLEQPGRPWPQGVAARCGAITVTTAELAAELRARLDDDDLRQACFELLLERALLARMPDLTPQAVERAVTGEVERRRSEAEANPEYRGLSYPQLLSARGLTLDVVRRDPAVRAAALARAWVERGFDDAELRAVYESERADFDGRFGEGVAVALIRLLAGERKNTLVSRTFEEAERELVALRARIGGTEDFLRLAGELSEDVESRQRGGEIGVVTRLGTGLPASLREAVFARLDQVPGDVSGEVLGPLRVQGGVVLLCLGARRPAPTWEEMSAYVARELGRRFLEESLPRSSLRTWLDQE